MSDTVIINDLNSVVASQVDTVQVVNSKSPSSVLIQQQNETQIVESGVQQTSIVSSCQIIMRTGGGGASAGLFVTDVDSSGSGIVGSKSYADTIPANTVVTEALTDDDTVTIHFLAEGGTTYSPTITVDGIICSNIVQSSGDVRLFRGSVDTVVTETRVVSLSSDSGTTTSVLINRAAAPPEILTCLIGDYPVGQTAVKANDTVIVSGTVEGTATHVRINGGIAFNAGSWVEVIGGSFSITAIVTANSGDQTCTVVAKNDIGSEGGTFESENSIVLDQTFPSFTLIGTNYPLGQSAFKGNEIGTQSVTVNNADGIFYSSPNGDFDITATDVYQEAKDIQCANPGHYNDSAINYRIAATRSANGSSATYNRIIEVADLAPIVVVTQPYARLRSSAAGVNYTIAASSNQNLASAPSLTVPVSGEFLSSFSGSGKYYTASIRMVDGDIAGSGAWVFASIPTNNAGIAATISGDQVVGGFTSRELTLAAFATETNLTAIVSDPSKLVLVWSFKVGMSYQVIGTAAPVVLGWTVDATGVTPTAIIILDTAAAGSSSQASTLTIEEVV